MCKYSATEEKKLRLHTERIHCQCGMCDVKTYSEKSFKAPQERKHCNQCGKVVKYVWHKNHFVKKDIYGDICRNP